MARWSTTYVAIPTPIVVVGGDGIIHHVNRSACQYAGLSDNEVVGKSVHELFHPSSRDENECLVCQYIARNEPLCDYEMFFQNKSQWYEVALRPIDNTIYISGVVHVMVDITERKNTELALKRSNESLELSQQKLRLHFEDTPLGVVEWDLDFRVASWNPRAEAIFGYTREEALGKRAVFIITNDQKDQVEVIWENLISQQGGLRNKNQNVTKSGEIITCEWYNTP